MHHHLLLRNLNGIGQKLLCPDRHFVGDPEVGTAVGINRDDRSVGFHESLVLRVGGEGMLEHLVGLGKTLFEVANLPGHVGMHIGKVGEKLLGRMRIRSVVGVKPRGVGLHGRFGIEDGRQFLVFHFNQGQSVLGHVWIFGGHHGHLFTNEAHPVARQNRCVVDNATG